MTTVNSDEKVCAKCKESLGKYATAPQFNCRGCWEILQARIATKDAQIEQLTRMANCSYVHYFRITRDGLCSKCGWSQPKGEEG